MRIVFAVLAVASVFGVYAVALWLMRRSNTRRRAAELKREATSVGPFPPQREMTIPPPPREVITATVRGDMETGFTVEMVRFNDGTEYRRLKSNVVSYPDAHLMSNSESATICIAAIEFEIRRRWQEEESPK